MQSNVDTAELSPQDRTIVVLVQKITLAPREHPATEIEQVRQHGIDDAGLLAITEIASYFNFINRMATTLDVQLEDEHGG